MASYTGTASLGDYSATKAAVLGMHESLVQELMHRHKDQGGHCVQASIVHPMWARTPLIGSWESQLNKSGQPVLTATTVAGRVVEQVLNGESGSVYLPEKQWQGTLVRMMPDWLAMAIRGKYATATGPPSDVKQG
jgi:short-subunit dehydrogenase